MKKWLNFIGPVFLVVLHILTGWAWILYFLGTMYVIIIVALLAAAIFARGKVEVEKFPTSNPQLAVMLLNNTMYIVYFSLISSWVLVGLVAVTVPLYYTVRAVCTKK